MASSKMAPKIAMIVSLLLLLSLEKTTSTQSLATKYQFQRLRETNMVFYMHDIETGPNATATTIAGVPNKHWSILDFGTVNACDDKLTVAYDHNSAQVGRAHGIYVNSALDGSDLHFLLSLVFTNKEYNGSTLEIQGANRVFQKYREVSVVSGTGIFRMGRGYATLETVFLDLPHSNAIVKWNLTVFHH